VPEGFALAAVEVEPDRVRISGARSEVLRLSEVITEPVALAGQTESFERELRLSAGARNAWVEEPSLVKVRVRIEPSPGPAAAPAPQGRG
jgi:YbbR domain-containing protein